MRRLGRFLVLCALFAGSAQAADPLAGLDPYVEKSMAAWETPGLSIAIVKDGKVVFARGYGVRQMGGETPVDADTVFAAGSISKTFTASAVAALIARDRLRWDDHVIDRLPDFRLYDPYVTREIRVRDLLCHRSGLPRGEMLWYYSTFDRKEILRRLRYLEPETGFRTAFGYQNLMFVAAGEVVASVAGMSWDNFIAETFLRPLGMTATSTSVAAIGGNAATPHARVDGKYRPIPWLNVDNIAPAGGVNTSANDLAKWMLFQLADGKVGDTALMLPGDVTEMRTPQTIIPVSKARRETVPDTLFRAYGLGWYLEDYRGVRMAYHGGRIDGMSSRLTLVPDRGLGIAVLTNRGRSSLPDALTYRVLDAYLGAPAKDWSGDFLKRAEDIFAQRDEKRERLLAQRIPDTHPSLPLESYAGSYDSELYGPLDIQYDGAALWLRRNDEAIATLSHFNYDTFLATFTSPALRNRLVTFSLDKLGHVAALDLEDEARFRATTPPLPNDLSFDTAASGDESRISGVWSGRWNGIQPTTLVVEHLDGDKASGVYAWGPAAAWGDTEGGWKRFTATVKDGTLRFALNDNITLDYHFASSGYVAASYEEGARQRRATLRRIQ